MLSRYQRTINIRHRSRRWYNGLSHLWYHYHKKMFGSLIVRGLKLRAYKRFSKLLVMIKRKERVEPRHIFLIACMRVTPRVAIKKLHRGTRIVFQPVPLPRTKQPSIVIQWLVKPLRDAQNRRNLSLKKLWELLTLSLRRRGEVHKRKFGIYKLARANKKPKARSKRKNTYKPYAKKRAQELRYLRYRRSKLVR